MSYGQPHVETIPTVSVTEGEEFATMVNAVLTEMRATLDAKVTPAGIDINADLSMRSGGTRYGLTNTHRVSLYQQPSNLAAATYPAALYASSAGELYFNDASGNQVALTNAGSIAGSPGSITGAGYGSGGVAVDWDSGASDYHFYSAASTYADIKVANVLLNDADTNFIRLDAPALAADYTLIFPNALPASTSLISSTSGGQLAFTRDPTVDTLTVTGAASVGGALTLSDALKHGEFQMNISALAGVPTTGTPTPGASRWTATGVGDIVRIPIQIDTGKRIKSVDVWGLDNDGTSFWRAELVRLDASSATTTQIGADGDTGVGFTGAGNVTIASLTETVLADYYYSIIWTAGAIGDEVYGVTVTYDRP